MLYFGIVPGLESARFKSETVLWNHLTTAQSVAGWKADSQDVQ
jgi:hypothetical protein